MTRDEIIAGIVALEDPRGPAASELVAAAVAELEASIRLALDVCDALDDGFRTEWGTAAGMNLPELLRGALSRVAEELGGEEELVRHRPGSWEADHVRTLGMVLS